MVDTPEKAKGSYFKNLIGMWGGQFSTPATEASENTRKEAKTKPAPVAETKPEAPKFESPKKEEPGLFSTAWTGVKNFFGFKPTPLAPMSDAQIAEEKAKSYEESTGSKIGATAAMSIVPMLKPIDDLANFFPDNTASKAVKTVTQTVKEFGAAPGAYIQKTFTKAFRGDCMLVETEINGVNNVFAVAVKNGKPDNTVEPIWLAEGKSLAEVSKDHVAYQNHHGLNILNLSFRDKISQLVDKYKNVKPGALYGDANADTTEVIKEMASTNAGIMAMGMLVRAGGGPAADGLGKILTKIPNPYTLTIGTILSFAGPFGGQIAGFAISAYGLYCAVTEKRGFFGAFEPIPEEDLLSTLENSKTFKEVKSQVKCKTKEVSAPDVPFTLETPAIEPNGKETGGITTESVAATIAAISSANSKRFPPSRSISSMAASMASTNATGISHVERAAEKAAANKDTTSRTV